MYNNLDAENTKLWGMYNSKKPDILYLGTDIYGCDELWWKDNNFDSVQRIGSLRLNNPENSIDSRLIEESRRQDKSVIGIGIKKDSNNMMKKEVDFSSSKRKKRSQE